MKEILEKVMIWHKKFGVNIEKEPIIPNKQRCKLRYDILLEEVNEFKEAYENDDIVEVADAFADILYVLLGNVVEFGLQDKFQEIFDEVHRSNLTKLDELGLPLIREDGKIMKSKLFSPPDIKSILNR